MAVTEICKSETKEPTTPQITTSASFSATNDLRIRHECNERKTDVEDSTTVEQLSQCWVIPGWKMEQWNV